MTSLELVDLAPLREAGSVVVAVSSSGVRSAQAIGQVTPDSPFRIASLTKPLTATATLLALDDAGLELDARVLGLLPHLQRDWPADRDLTVADLLSQTSGLASTVTGADVAALGDDDSALQEASRLVVRAGSARPPGRAWEYYNGNYFLAGAVLSAVSGTTYERAMESRLLRPWGLSSTTYAGPEGLVPGVEDGAVVPATPYPRGRRPSGGLCSTATDLLRFAEQLLAHDDVLARVRRVRTAPDDPMSYGLGCAVGPSGQLFLNGRLPGYRMALLLVPDQRLAAVVLAASSEALPAAARVLSDRQQDLTGDDLTTAIDEFAA